MRLVAAVLLAIAAAPARAEQAADAPAPTSAGPMRLELREQVQFAHEGATAAFAIDASIVEVSVHDGKVALVARNLGSTTISVVTAGDIASFPVTVVAPPPWAAFDVTRELARRWTVYQGGYESLTTRLTDSLEVMDDDDHRRIRAYAVNVTRLGATTDGDARSSFPALSLEWHAPSRELVVFDKLVEHSPLTLEGTTLRGVHVREGGLELHAGVTSPLLYQDVFLPTQSEIAIGASYELREGRSSLVPSIYAYPSTPATGGTRGTAETLLYHYRSDDDRLEARGELGWGGRLGAAGELTYQDGTTRGWLVARHEPRGFAALGYGRPLGSMADGMWSAESGALTMNVAGTAARYDVGAHEEDVATLTTEYRVRVVRPVSASAGLSIGYFGGDLVPEPVRSLTVPLGVHVETTHFGVSAIYRYMQNTARDEGGHGGRLSVRASSGWLRASAFADVQQEAATLDLILHDQPVLAEALAELGLTAATPDDLARLLRDNATLAQLGVVEGASLEFHPWRAQAGFDVAWAARDRSRQEVRLRGLADRTHDVAGEHDSTSASLAYARRLGAQVDVTAMASWWRLATAMTTSPDTWSIAAGIRVRFDDVPHLRSVRDLDGEVVDESGSPVPNVAVHLDGGRIAHSDRDGHFTFERVAGGDHRVEADAPEGTFFTAASRVVVAAGGHARFTLAVAPARLAGLVRDDAGNGLAGVTVALRGAGTATTDSSGRFRFTVAAGTYELAVVDESVPVGYASAPSQQLELSTDRPHVVEIVVPAQRSIAGTVHGEGATIAIVELDRSGVVDANGRYVFRDLPPGVYTVEATVGGVTTRRVIDLGEAPQIVRGIDFP